MILILLSAAFVGGSAAVPATMAAIGFLLMVLGRRSRNEETRI
jgi:hypothetical protein